MGSRKGMNTQAMGSRKGMNTQAMGSRKEMNTQAMGSRKGVNAQANENGTFISATCLNQAGVTVSQGPRLCSDGGSGP